jgi:hypothetical protein
MKKKIDWNKNINTSKKKEKKIKNITFYSKNLNFYFFYSCKAFIIIRKKNNIKLCIDMQIKSRNYSGFLLKIIENLLDFTYKLTTKSGIFSSSSHSFEHQTSFAFFLKKNKNMCFLNFWFEEVTKSNIQSRKKKSCSRKIKLNLWHIYIRNGMQSNKLLFFFEIFNRKTCFLFLS